LFVVGSIRKGSFNRQLASMAADIVKDWAEVDYMDIASFPLMNQDAEFPAPSAVSEARRQLSECDAVWVFTPEYNRSIPGPLKNAMDWLSRPLDPQDPDRVSAVKGKKAIICGAGGGKKTEFSRKALDEMLSFIGMEVIGGDGCGFALDRRAFAENIWEPGDDVKDALKVQAAMLKEHTEN